MKDRYYTARWLAGIFCDGKFLPKAVIGNNILPHLSRLSKRVRVMEVVGGMIDLAEPVHTTAVC